MACIIGVLIGLLGSYEISLMQNITRYVATIYLVTCVFNVAIFQESNNSRQTVYCSLVDNVAFFFFQEAAWFVADECIQILGGMGYMKVSNRVCA